MIQRRIILAKQKHTSWDTDSGLLDDYDFVVEEAWFGEDEESDNNDGRIFLFLRGTATDEEGETFEEHRERYSTGKNWDVVDDGEEVENASGKGRFNQNAGIGRLINALVALGDDEAEYLQGRGQTFQAATYDGLRLHMEQKLVSKWLNDDYDEDDPNSRKYNEWLLNLPTSLTIKKAKSKSKSKSKGKGGSGKAGRGKVKGQATKAKKAKSPKSSLRSEVAEFAGQFGEDEHDEFVDQVLDSDVFPNADSIMDDDELHADVLDPDSDMWEQAH